MDAKVFAVDVVVFNQTKSLPPLLLLQAKGRASTSGWTNGRLSPYVYIAPPADGIWDFDFIATTPAGIALQVISPIESEVLMVTAPSWCRGVRVHASTNKLDSSTPTEELDPSKMLTPANWVPFPWAKGAMKTMQADMTAGANVQAGDDLIPWPWVMPADDGAPNGASDANLLARPVKDLIGPPVRVYRQGDMVTMDHRPDRVNIVLSRYGNTIAEIKLG